MSNEIAILATIIGISLMYATPLIFTSLGGVLSENAGVINIGLEGMMAFGAFFAATVGFYTLNPWLAFLAGGLAGAAMALLHAVATVTFTADHVISGVAINFIGPGLAIFLSRIFFDGAAMTVPIPIDSKIPMPLSGLFEQGSIVGRIFNQYATVYIAFILVAVVWFLMYKTRFGLRLRSVGEYPRAAETLGIKVRSIKYVAVILSGLFAGFGGAAMSLAIVNNYRITLISGHGFIALAAMIFGKWRPQGAMWACLLFGFAQGISVYLGSTALDISSSLLAMVPYVITILALVFVVGEAHGPKANGIPYEKNEG